MGCFGGQSYINHKFLLRLETKYNITNLVNVVKNRPDRCCLERILGFLFSIEKQKNLKTKSLFGKIHDHQEWGYIYINYEKDFMNKKLKKPIIKVWTGR